MIPHFDGSGTVPFIYGDPTSSLRSPYEVGFEDFAKSFCTTPERAEILIGLLDLRSELSKFGVSDGFQLIDGSYLEDVERLRGRPPSDIDLVTFARKMEALAGQNADLATLLSSTKDELKNQFKCDHFWVDLDSDDEVLVSDAMYWFSLFSHQRDTFKPKGMAKIPLALNEDPQALAIAESFL